MDVLKQYISYQLKYIEIHVVNIYTHINNITPIIDTTRLIFSLFFSTLPTLTSCLQFAPHGSNDYQPKISRSNFSSLNHEDYIYQKLEQRVALSQYVLKLNSLSFLERSLVNNLKLGTRAVMKINCLVIKKRKKKHMCGGRARFSLYIITASQSIC